MKSSHPDKSEREKEDAAASANKMVAMAEAVAKVRNVAKLEVKYGTGSVNRARVTADPLSTLEALGWLTIFMGCGMTLPEGDPKDFFEWAKENPDKAGAAPPNVRDEIHEMHMREFGDG